MSDTDPPGQGSGEPSTARLELEIQEGLFLLRVWHEGGEGDVWGWSLDRVNPDDMIGGRSVPGINALADEIQPPGSPENEER